MSKEHAYAYEAGYRDGSINYELEHCPACKNVADLQEALAENAKLREQVDAAHMSRLLTENENESLRKLVRDMWRTMGLLNACDVSEYDEPLNCIYCEQWGNVGKNIVGCKLMYRMDELRIETD